MALSVVNNATAIGAQSSVNAANSALNKTIRALSTGLRINSAADDASGLAVSEKLRAQISGLDKAATNAQDAISMLQTAEGAMGSMTSMVQRIRELAVQAGDPAYTANDRAMLQLEVDQLKQEIDRVSATSEFNTKKLLNGDAAAIWSASTDNIEAIIKGTPAEGNYAITYDLDPGRNSVYKSNIMRLGSGEMSYDIKANGTSITKFDDVKGMLNEKGQTFTVVDSTAVTADARVAGATGKMGNAFNAEVFTTATEAADDTQALAYAVEIEAVTGVKGESGALNNLFNKTFLTAAGTASLDPAPTMAATTKSLYIEYQGSVYELAAGFAVGATGQVTGGTATRIEGTTGPDELEITAELLSGTAGTNDRVFEFQINTGDVKFSDVKVYETQSAQMKYRVRDTATGELSQWSTFTMDEAGTVKGASALETRVGGKTFHAFANSGGATFDVTAYANLFEAGDRMLINVTGARAEAEGAATFQLGDTGAAVHLAAPASDPNIPTTHTLYTAQMDNAGNVYYGQIDFQFNKGVVVAGTGTIDILGEGDVASKYTKLSQLSQFTNADGRMLLDNTQEISIYAGNGKVAKVTLEGSDTIKDLEEKLNTALVEQLDLGADPNNPNAVELNKNLVKYVEVPVPGSDRAVQGTFVIQGAVLGANSNLTFVGDEGVLNALGVTQIQEAKDSALNVRVSDAHTGEFIGEDTITDGRLRNIIQGVDVIIKPESAADISFNPDTNTIEFKAKAEPTTAYLHIKNNSTKAAIGANEGQTLDLSIGRLDTVSMGIQDVNVATFESAQKAITKLDMALEQISAARATAGAQMNRLEYTISNLTTTRENMVASESRIRDLDIAKASTQLASQQVLLQSATAMLAQANQIPSYAMRLLQ